MALGMKQWWGLVVSGMALVAVWLLPPESLERHRQLTPTHEELRARALEGELRRTHGVLLRTRWADSLSRLAIETEVDGIAVGVPADAPLTPSVVADWKARVAAQEAALSPRADEMVLGYFVQNRGHGAVEGMSLGVMGDRETYVGVLDGRPFCLRVAPRYGVDDAGFEPSSIGPVDRIGPCRLYAQYGMPGSPIHAWLESGAMEFARARSDEPTRSERFRPILFGLNRPRFLDQPLEMERCLSGIAEGCLRTVTLPELIKPDGDEAYIVANSPASALGSMNWRSIFGYHDDYLLADLEREFGPEAFSRFWKSDAEVPEAFETAFGMEMGAWVVTWVDDVIGAHPPGPTLSAGMLGGSLLTLLLLAGIITLVARRRTVSG